MHRIPSELRNLACLGEGSTKMGDLLGSPRVAPLLLSFKPVNPLFAADAITFCARQKVSIACAGSAGNLDLRGAGKGPRRDELRSGRAGARRGARVK
ncbi:hypothetical protein AB3S75_045112 [Citrus x aurantiifolia]